MSFPSVSVVITSHNQKEYLVEAIDSVVSQTLRPREIIVADDHSGDGSVEVIESYLARHPGWIKGLFQSRNVGVSKNRNSALAEVRGELLTILDGDDRFLPRKLEMEVATYLKHPEAQIVHSNFYYIDSSGGRIRLWADGEIPPSGYVFPQVFARHYPRGTTFHWELVESRCLREIVGYDETLALYEDWDAIIRLTKRFNTAYCPEPLVEYRVHTISSSRVARGSAHLAAVKKVYEKNRALLQDLPASNQVEIARSFRRRCATLAIRAALDAMDTHDRRRAFAYWAESLHHDSRTLRSAVLARILLPAAAYRGLRTAYESWVPRG